LLEAQQCFENIPNLADAAAEKYGAPVKLWRGQFNVSAGNSRDILNTSSNDRYASQLTWKRLSAFKYTANNDQAIAHWNFRALGDNKPLWNFSSIGGTIRRSLAKRAVEEVVTW